MTNPTARAAPLLLPPTLLLSILASGVITSISALTIPCLLAGLDHPTIPSQSSSMVRTTPSKADDRAPRETGLVLTQWRRLYALGSKFGPGLLVPGAVGYATCAWSTYARSAMDGNRRCMMLMAAAVCNLAVVPFTILTLGGVNTELHRREEAAKGVKGQQSKEKERGETSEELIRWWGVLNFVRGLFPLVGVGLGWRAL